MLGACGGGGGSASGTATASAQLSAPDFRAQADAICQKYDARIKDLGTPTSVDDLQDFIAKAEPIVEQGNAELHGLNPPDELQADWDRVLQIQDQNVQKFHDLEGAIQNGDMTQVQAISKSMNSTQAEAQQLAQKLGLQNCGSTTPS